MPKETALRSLFHGNLQANKDNKVFRKMKISISIELDTLYLIWFKQRSECVLHLFWPLFLNSQERVKKGEFSDRRTISELNLMDIYNPWLHHYLYTSDTEVRSLKHHWLCGGMTHITWRQLQELSFGFLYSCAKRLDDALRNSLQRCEVRHTVDVLSVRHIRNLFQLRFICIFDTDRIHNNSSPLQVLGVGLHGVLRFAIGDHHSDLRHILASPASRLLHKVLIQHEVQALARVGATPQVRQFVDVTEDVFLVLIGVEQELSAWSGAVLDQPDADMIGPDVEAVDQRVQKPTDLLEVFSADAPGPVDQEDDVCDGLLSADWGGRMWSHGGVTGRCEGSSYYSGSSGAQTASHPQKVAAWWFTERSVGSLCCVQARRIQGAACCQVVAALTFRWMQTCEENETKQRDYSSSSLLSDRIDGANRRWTKCKSTEVFNISSLPHLNLYIHVIVRGSDLGSYCYRIYSQQRFRVSGENAVL